MKFDVKLKALFLMFFLCVIAFIPSKSFATLVDGVEYSIYTDGSNNMYVSGCDSDLTTAIIQPEINGRKVTAIGNSAFSGCSKLTSIIIPKGIEIIDNGAFSGCSKLTNINLPYGVKTIGLYAFSNCSSLEEIDIPDSVTKMKVYSGSDYSGYTEGATFLNCKSLQRVKLSSNMTDIPTQAFKDCTSLTEINIPDSIINIYHQAFSGCSSLKRIEISKNTKLIMGGVFNNCTSLEYVKISSNTGLSEKRYFGQSYNYPIFKNCPNLTLDVVQNSPAEIYAINNNINYTIYAYPINVVSVDNIQDCTYTGEEIKPEIIIKHNEKILKEGKDYTLSYTNNINAGIAGVLIQGIGMYESTTSTTFNIIEKDISKSVISNIIDKQYIGSSIKQNIIVKDGNIVLKEFKDYNVLYENNINAGLATLTLNGIGNYKGSKSANFIITKATYDMSNVKFEDLEVTYDGKVHSINAIGLPKGVTVSYENNNKTNVGEYQVIAKFTGDSINYKLIPNMTATLKINKALYNMSNIKFDSNTWIYDGKEHSLKVTGLPEGVTVNYENNKKINSGEYEVIAVFTNNNDNYESIENRTAILKIIPKEIINISSYIDTSDKVYTGNDINTYISLRNGNLILKDGIDFNIKYINNKKVGKATIEIIGKGNYKGSIYKTFNILPKGTTVSKLTKDKKKTKVTWKKQKTETTGYEIQYSTNSKFNSGNKTINIKKNNIASVTIKKLKSKKKYYVRIRTYKTVNGKKYYSDWSKAKSVKVK